MKNIYNINTENWDIDLTFYEKWISLDSSLTIIDIDAEINNYFEDKYKFNEVVKQIFIKEHYICDLLNDEEQKMYDAFNESLNDSDIENYLLELKNENTADVHLIAWPFTYHAINYFKKNYSTLLNKSVIPLLCIQNIIAELTKLAIKCHILELNDQDKHMEYISSGNYGDFVKVEILNKNYINNFYLKYPILFARCIIRMNNLLKYYAELITNIEIHYNIMDVKQLHFGEGDTHGGGKTVVKIVFDNKTIYYKPKNLMIEKYYNEFLELFGVEKLDTSENIYTDHYSFVMDVKYLPVQNIQEAEEFYYSLGMLQFILYVLGANDIHYENIIAHGKFPVVIDLETLFQINYDLVQMDNIEIYDQQKNQINLLQNMGILPIKIPTNGNAFDISALAGKAAEKIDRREQLVDISTMEMAIREEYVHIGNKKNIPFLEDGNMFDYLSYSEKIIEGFNSGIEKFFAMRENITEFITKIPNSIIVRNVLRPTYIYGDFLSYTNHPIYMKDFVRYNKLFENLTGLKFRNNQINLSEINDIIAEDIPLFFSRIGETNIYNSKFKNLGTVWNMTPKDKVLHRILDLDETKKAELLANMKIQLEGLDRDELMKNSENNMTDEIVYEDLMQRIKQNGLFFNTIIISPLKEFTYTSLDYGMYNGLIGVWLYFVTRNMKSMQDKEIIGRIERHLDEINGLFVEINESFMYNQGSLLLYYWIKYQIYNEDDDYNKFLNLSEKMDDNLLHSIFNIPINFDLNKGTEQEKIQKIYLHTKDNLEVYRKDVLLFEKFFVSPSFGKLHFFLTEAKIFEKYKINLEGLYENSYN